MPSNREKRLQFELAKAVAKRDMYYAKIKEMYELSKKIEDPAVARDFEMRYVGFQAIREQFRGFVELVNNLNFQITPDYQPTYELLKDAEWLECGVVESAKKLQIEASVVVPQRSEVPAAPRPTFRVPEIVLPEFDGDVAQWPPFYEKFSAIIDNNPDLDNLHKMHYLVGALKGKALDMCQGLAATAANYPVLLDALKAMYDNKRNLAGLYFDQMMDAKPLSTQSASGLGQLIVRFDAALKSLEKLGLPDLFRFCAGALLLRKLDPDTRRAFETSSHAKVPSYPDILNFLHAYVEALSQIPKTRNPPAPNPPKPSFHPLAPRPKTLVVNTPSDRNTMKCPVCGESHHLFKCPAFNRRSTEDRLILVQQNDWCSNCLSHTHRTMTCNSVSSCKVCGKSHHSLLHLEKQTDSSPGSTAPSVDPPARTLLSQTPGSSLVDPRIRTITLLPTAVVRVSTPSGYKLARFLVDSGSQRHVLTLDCCRKFNLKYQRQVVPLEGMGSTSVNALGVVQLRVRPRFRSSVSFDISAVVAEKITQRLPSSTVDTDSLEYLRSLTLADNGFGRPGDIDGVLGAQIFGQLLTGPPVFGPDCTSQALPTKLGYLVLGDVPDSSSRTPSSPARVAVCVLNLQTLHNTVQRFWELEEVPKTRPTSLDDRRCEELFQATTSRPEGYRYRVRLPFRVFPPALGDSRANAQKRFYALERKFAKNPLFHAQYTDVIKDYLAQGHMTRVTEESSIQGESHFIPHFAVVKASSSTPLRVVFDASAKTANGRSLNDSLFTGPKLQKDLAVLLIAFRASAVALVADIRQMYRNIAVHPEHRCYQRIFWRETPQEPLQILELNCVVFGLTAAPYLALRTVHQLAADEASRFPLAAQLADRCMYVDDLVASLDSTSEALNAYEQLDGLFKAGGFKLTKWASNAPELLLQVPPEDRVHQDIEFQDASRLDETIGVLGLAWNCQEDTFSFKIRPFYPINTKRGILSLVAKIWDPLGLLAPAILFAKLLIKETWAAGLDWDEALPASVSSRWQQFTLELPQLQTLRFPRHWGTTSGDAVTLVGFADSSEKAYGAVVYLRPQGNPTTAHLIYAKSRVAPQKVVTLPKLELCAALLLAEIMGICSEVLSSRFRTIDRVALTDSTVTLAWIQNNSRKREVFVANRIAVIERILPPECWFHVRSEDNIADVISRGLRPSQLVNHRSWIHGPSWLKLERQEWPTHVQPATLPPFDVAVEESPEVILIATGAEADNIEKFLTRFSSFQRLLRVTVWLLRFGRRLPLKGTIDPTDLDYAENILLRQVQQQHFALEVACLRKNESCSPKLRALCPFMDGELIRVGGRLRNSDAAFATKHPVLLPPKSHLTALIVDDCHRANCHTGAQLVSALLRQKYWILAGRNLIRRRLHLCNTCFRHQPRQSFPHMADLPAARVQEAKSFVHTGVDYAGPFQVTPSRRRGVRSQKAYLCLFVCLASKAVHLELASDLSSSNFLACFKRFISRRGPVSCLYSDRGTNFVGAKAELDALYTFLHSEEFHSSLHDHLTCCRITWKFNPPHAPHFGGIWEANIKSAKNHLAKVIGSQILSYEEFNTVLVQIEALLNSRPLYASTSDPSDPEALTPAHFLNLTPLHSLPLSDALPQSAPHSRKTLLDTLVRSFWRRWHLEYLGTLQQRQKWNTPTNPLSVGTVVVLKELSSTPLQWPLAVVEEVHPGRDGVTRVATVRTSKARYIRPVSKLCPLPSQ